VNKPAGLLVHGGSPSVVEWLIKNYPRIKSVGEDKERPGIVHRLDKDTSGVLLIAKNQKSFEWLKNKFQNREIKKKYLVLVKGKIKDNFGIIDLPIGKSKKDFRKKTAGKNARGEVREAITEYKVIKRFDNYTLAEAFPKTGRTHQIRAHFKALGYPIAGDRLYGHGDNLPRQFLHANSVELTLMNNSRVKIEADLPEELKKYLNMLNYDYV
jgi:23S rRNA pseudouridine1911/1915/1917 synthase